MQEQAQRTEGRQLRPRDFLVRLVIVLVVVVVVVVLAKRAMALDRKLQAVLEDEIVALNRGDWSAFVRLQDPDDAWFRRYQKSVFDSYRSAQARREAVAQPAAYVVEVGRWGDQAWALVMEDPEADPESGPAKIEFFRRAYGQWLHTGPDPDHWGKPQESLQGQITWRYREADEEQVARLVAFAEACRQQVSTDVGLDPEEGFLVINLCYSSDCANVIEPHDRVIELPTPLLHGLDQEGLQYTLANLLVSHLVHQATGLDARSSAVDSRLLRGIERWEAVQVTDDPGDGDDLLALQQAVAGDTLLTLEELSRPLEGESMALASDQAYMLVEYTVTQYGRQVLPALVWAAARQEGVTGALQEVLGADLDLAAFETGWLGFIRGRYGN